MTGSNRPSDTRVRIKAYLGAYGGGLSHDGPPAWAIVEVEPWDWKATLPIHELLDVLIGEVPEVNLGGIPYRWQGDELVVELGPARAIATAGEWEDLSRRLLVSADSSEGLYEVPGARPWTGPVAEVAVGSFFLGDPPADPGSDDPTPAEQLARAGGFDLDDFIEIFGSDWATHEPPDGDGLDFCPIFLWGDPPQLAATIDLDGLEIGRPRGSWGGAAHLYYDIEDSIPVGAALPEAEVREAVKVHLRRRRRSFGWCRFCGDLLPPERRYEPGVCYGCATDRYGMVY